MPIDILTQQQQHEILRLMQKTFSQSQSADMIPVEADWKMRKHQRVTLRNTSRTTRHAVLDRNRQPVVLEPGEAKEADLLVDMIETLRELRRPGRIIEKMTDENEIYAMRKVEAPLHPVVVEGLPDSPQTDNEKAKASRR